MSAPPITESRFWPVADLRANPANPRGAVEAEHVQELAESIRAQGILQPLLITPEGLLVAGHRRHKAAQLVGLQQVPVIVRELSAGEQLEIMLVENLQRQDLTPIQEGRAYQRLVEAGYSRADICRRVGVSPATVTYRLQLLELDPEVQQMIHRGELAVVLGKSLAQVKEPFQQRRLATMAVRRRVTIKQMETLVERALGTLNAPSPAAERFHQAEQAQAAGGPSLSRTRREMQAQLLELADTPVTVAEMVRVLEGTCCACGLDSEARMCQCCPLMDTMRDLLEALRAKDC